MGDGHRGSAGLLVDFRGWRRQVRLRPGGTFLRHELRQRLQPYGATDDVPNWSGGDLLSAGQ